MTDAELDNLERLYEATSRKPWAVTHVDDDGIEKFSITSDRLSTVCILEEDEPFELG